MEVTAQETAATPIRTPEQEAALQTQKIQKELQLDTHQQQAIYEINLKHARERQVSNSRAQALERTKNKNAAIKQVLTHDQYDQLQNKRYERYPAGNNTYINRTLPQQRQTQSTSEKRNTEIATPQNKREIALPSTRNVPMNTTIRSNPALVPSRDKTPARPPASSSSNHERPQRR